MKNLLLLTAQYPFGKGETFLEQEIKFLAKNFNVTILSRDGSGIKRKVPENVKVFKLKKRNIFVKIGGITCSFFNKIFWQDLKIAKKNNELTFHWIIYLSLSIAQGKHIKRTILKNPILKNNNILYSYWSNPVSYSLVLVKQALNNMPKIVLRAHRYDLYKTPSTNFAQPLKFYMDKYVDSFVFISMDGYNYYKKNYANSNKDKYFISYLGIENEVGLCNKSQDNVLRIVSCSYIKPVKRVNLIIEALSKINNINIEWTHLGDGQDSEKIKQLAYDKLRHINNLKYDFKGYVSNKDIYKIYKDNQIDLFINVSESEGIPVSIMEAMSFGIPIIATDVGGVREIVDKSMGYLMDGNTDANQISKLILSYYYEDNNKKDILRKNSRAKWEKVFNGKNNYNLFVDYLDNL